MKTNTYAGSWVREIDKEIENLHVIRIEFRRRLEGLDLETEALWLDQERRWRRLKVKIQKLAVRKKDAVNPGLATNIENLISALEEGYEELDSLLD